RSQYLGKLKRRMFLGAGTGAVPAVGADVVGSSAEPVGRVVLSAAGAGTDRFVVLFECRSDALPEPPASDGAPPAATALRIGDAALPCLPRPYGIVDTTPSDAA